MPELRLDLSNEDMEAIKRVAEALRWTQTQVVREWIKKARAEGWDRAEIRVP